MDLVMRRSLHMKMITETNDTEFITYCMYLRDYTIPKQDVKIITQLIVERCKKLGYEFNYGCCGTNILTRITL